MAHEKVLVIEDRREYMVFVVNQVLRPNGYEVITAMDGEVGLQKALSESPDLIYWGNHKHVMSRGGSGWWQGTKIGAGPTPIETTEGWLLLYHGQ